MGNSYYDSNTLKPGHLEIADLNGDGIINYYDRTVIGSPEPDVYGGLIANLGYKDFTLFCNFGYQIGGKNFTPRLSRTFPASSQDSSTMDSTTAGHLRIPMPNIRPST